MGQYISPDLIKICKVCGEPFHPTSRKQVCCNREIQVKCAVCGKPFTVICNTSKHRSTCSSECNKILIRQNQKSSAAKQLKQCEWCGELFSPTSSRDKYCKNKHYQVCQVCGNLFEIDVRVDKTVKTCSKECRYKLAKSSTDTTGMVENLKSTMVEKYGVDNAMKCPDFKEKLIATNRKKYGFNWYTQTDEYKESVKETSLSKYGTAHFLSSDIVKSKRRETCKDRYGFNNYGFLMVDHPEKLDKWIEFRADGKKYIDSHYTELPTRNQLSEDLGVSYSTISQEIRTKNLDNYVQCNVSYMEDEVTDALHDIDPNLQIIRRCKSIIYPYELDIYIPDCNLAIECNPTYTHNSSITSYTNPPKPIRYHQMKTELCEKQGVFLFHIFGYEWYHKQDVIVSMLRNLLRKNDHIVYARNCKIEHIEASECRKFLDSNHRQGYASASVKLGLYHEGALVSVMTFGKLRNTIGTDKSNTSNCWELVRFCSKTNTSVVGGASRLFKYFIRMYDPVQIRSFSDRAHTKGTLYEKLGFYELRRSEPGYVWVDLTTDSAINRVSAQKSNLRKFLHDDNIDLTLSESQIMTQHGFVKVCDSGTITWEWKMPN